MWSHSCNKEATDKLSGRLQGIFKSLVSEDKYWQDLLCRWAEAQLTLLCGLWPLLRVIK